MNGHLLDTHVLLWALFAPEKLSDIARNALLDTQQDAFVSTISLWEISLKYALGKLQLKHCTPEDIASAARESGFIVLPLLAEEAGSFHRLPRLAHRDPFDRMLVHQAILHDLALISRDGSMQDYKQHGLQLIW